MTADLTAAECGGQGSPAAAAPHLVQAAVSGQGEGGGVEVEPVLPDVEGGHLAGLALHPAAGVNSYPKPSRTKTWCLFYRYLLGNV